MFWEGSSIFEDTHHSNSLTHLFCVACLVCAVSTFCECGSFRFWFLCILYTTHCHYSVCMCVVLCVCVCVCVSCFSILYTQTLHYTVTARCCFFFSYHYLHCLVIYFTFTHKVIAVSVWHVPASVFTDRCASCVVSTFCEHGSVFVLQHTVSVVFSYCCILFIHLLCYCSVCMYGLVPACMCTVSMCMCTCVWVQLAHVLKIDCPNTNCTCTVHPVQSRCHKCNELSLLLVLHLSLLQSYIFFKIQNKWFKLLVKNYNK